MTHRIISPGWGPRRPLVVGYLWQRARPPGQPHLDDQVREALSGATIIGYEDADGEPLAETERRARELGWPGGPLVLMGYSAGCLRGIRQRLLDGADPAAVIAIDGTHASLPPENWQLDVWRRLWTAAVAGRKLFVATHTYLTYVEGKEARPRYQATVTTLRQVTGLALAQGGDPPLGVEASQGDAHVHSYRSSSADQSAHGKQLLYVLPAMVSRYLAPYLARLATAGLPPPSEPEPRPSSHPPPEQQGPSTVRVLRRGMMNSPAVRAWQERLHELGFDAGVLDGDFGGVTERATMGFQASRGLDATGLADGPTQAAAAAARTINEHLQDFASLGEAMLAQARADLRDGVRESSYNDGKRIQAYFAGTGAAPPDPWCGAAQRDWLRRGGRTLGIEPAKLPIQGSVGAKATMRQLQKARRWVDAEEIRRNPELLRPGMIAVWHRGAPGAPTGHIGAVSVREGRDFAAIEGNSGQRSDRVAEMPHNVNEPNFLGAGWVD
ncbi:peptidoglycan-binding protein [Sorangium sp. So ce216]